MSRSATSPVYFVGRTAACIRVFLQWVLLWPIVRWFCHPLVVQDRPRKFDRPVVFVANHASHADTAVILRALPLRLRFRTMPAAAQDHFWHSQIKGAFVSLLTGAFPFPRRGSDGLRRSEEMLARGRNVLLFPEGTRAKDGCLAEFQRGIGILASRGATIVPVAIRGTERILPKGSSRPRSAPVSVTFGQSTTYEGGPEENVASIKDSVEALLTGAERVVSERRETPFERLARFAQSRTALVLLFLWAFAEALLWPLVPDLLLLPLALVAPRRCLLFVGAVLAGSVSGGCIAHLIGDGGLGSAALEIAPLVTQRMTDTARDALAAAGADALFQQPLSGIPYKVFAYQTGDAHVGLWGLAVATAIGRGLRFAAVGLVGALAGRLAKPVWERFISPFLVLYSVVFAIGLARVVASWR